MKSPRFSRHTILAAVLSVGGWMSGCSGPTMPGTVVPPPATAASAAATIPTKAVETLALLKPADLPAALVVDPSTYGAENPKVQALAQTLAAQYRLDPAWVLSALAQARYNPTVARLIMPAATPSVKNWQVYRSRFVEPVRLRHGLSFWNEHQTLLQRASQQYGVPAEIIASIIGVETIYGRQTGQFRVLDALATLSLDFPSGRSDRSRFFQTQLGEFLRLCAEQGDQPTQVLGSYAGAIGWPQFMPGSIRRYAVDFDRDGHIDLQSSIPDTVGSVANFLSQHGWQVGLPTHFQVSPPSDSQQLRTLLEPDILPSFKASEMARMGAQLDTAGTQYRGLLALVLLENGGQAPSYVAGTENFYAITRYNNSSYYAMAVIELANAIASGQIARMTSPL